MKSSEKIALTEVVYGIKLVRAGLILTVLGTVAGFFLTVLLQSSGRGSLPFLSAVALLLGVLTTVMALLGQAYCLYAPRASRSRAWVASAFLFGLAGLVLELSGVVPSLSLFAEASRFTAVVRVAGFIAFLVFLKRIATFASARVVADEVGQLIKRALILDLLTVVVTCLMVFAKQQRSEMLVIFCLFGLLLLGLLGLTLVLRYLAAMTAVERAIEMALVDPPAEEASLFGGL